MVSSVDLCRGASRPPQKRRLWSQTCWVAGQLTRLSCMSGGAKKGRARVQQIGGSARVESLQPQRPTKTDHGARTTTLPGWVHRPFLNSGKVSCLCGWSSTETKVKLAERQYRFHAKKRFRSGRGEYGIVLIDNSQREIRTRESTPLEKRRGRRRPHPTDWTVVCSCGFDKRVATKAEAEEVLHDHEKDCHPPRAVVAGAFKRFTSESKNRARGALRK